MAGLGLVFLAPAEAQPLASPETSSAASAGPAKWVGHEAPDFALATEAGPTKRLKDFRGSWVFLEFGQVNCEPSEEVAAHLSQVQLGLAAHPFVFIHAYAAPSFDDIRLAAKWPHHGLRALSAERPEFYDHDTVPLWFLIDPKGMVRAAGQYLTWPMTLAVLGRHLPFGAEMIAKLPPGPGPGPEEQRAAELTAEKKHKEAEPILQALFAAEPANARVIDALTTCTAWVRGYPAANKFLREALQKWPGDQPIPGFVRRKQIKYLRVTEPRFSTRSLIEAVQKDYPASRLLECFLLEIQKAPAELAPHEVSLLLRTSSMDDDAGMQASAAYGAEAIGNPDLAARLWPEIRLATRLNRMALVRFLQSHGQAAEAQKIVQKEVGAVTLAETNKVRIWEAMLFHLAAANLPKAKEFAAKYCEVRPEFALGRLTRLFVALQTGDPAEIKTASDELASFATKNPAYALCREMQLRGAWQLDRIHQIGSEKDRNDAMLWAVLVPAAQGQRPDALRHAREFQKNAERTGWGFTFLWMIDRWLEKQPGV